jgi:uncharacterized protein YjdB
MPRRLERLRAPATPGAWLAPVVLLLLLLFPACSDGTGAERVARVDVTAAGSLTTLVVGETVQLTAAPKTSGGRVLDRPVAWSSASAAVATVDPVTGFVTAVAPGAVRITASSGGATGGIDLVVSPVPVAGVKVAPGDFTLYVRWTRQLAVELTDARGNVLTGREVSFTSSDPNVVLVGSTGLATAQAPGTAVVTAASEGKSAGVRITVANAPVFKVDITPAAGTLSDNATVSLSATPLDERGNTLQDRGVTWASSNLAIATVSPSGRVAGLTPGQATITATVEGKTGSVLLTVRPHVETVEVVAPAGPVRVGERGVVPIVLRDVDGNVLTDREYTWSTSNSGVLAFLSDGRYYALEDGTATLTVRSEGKTGSAVFVVVQPVFFVQVTPHIATVPVGGKTQIVASVFDPRGRPLTGRAVTYTSSSPAVATVDASGVVTAKAKGTADITATSEGKSAVSRITVP